VTRSTVLTLTAAAPTVDAVTISGTVTAADAATRTLTGRCVLFGQTGETSVGPARFAPGALAASDPRRVKLLVEHDVSRVVGYATAVVEDAQGVTATFHVPAGAAGDEVLASAAAGLRDGLSVGVGILNATRGTDGAIEVSRAEWRETSVVALPAFTGSVVSNVAASAPVALAAAPAAGHVVAPILTPSVPATLTAPRRVDLSAAFDAMAAAFRDGGVEGLLAAATGRMMTGALTDVVLPSPGGGAGQDLRDAMIPPQWIGELWQARNAGKRPLIDSIQRKPLTSYRVTGTQRTYPAWGVDVYAGNKTAIPSPGTYSLVVVSKDATRIAGGHDFDRVFLDFPADYGSGSFLDSYFSDQTDNYLELTESQVATELAAAAWDTGFAADVLAGLTSLAAYLGARGASVDFVKVAPDLYAAALAIPKSEAPWLIDGSANLNDSSANVGGLNIRAEASLPAATMVAGDRRCATFYEWKNPPLRVQAVNIPNGGVDLAVFGYTTLIVNDAASVATVTIGVDPGGARSSRSSSKAAAAS
jgi:HK97 family phage prohead protease